MASETEVKLALWEKKGRLIQLLAQILPGLEQGQTRKLIEQHRSEAQKLLSELAAAKFDCKAVNQRLKQYRENAPKWREGFM